MRSHTKEESYHILERNGHQVIPPGPKGGPTIIKTRGIVGLKILGVIDFLVNHKGHFHQKL